MMENVGMYIPQNELLFIATDERNKSFFNDFRPRFPVLRFLDDYMDIAGLRNINPNYLGMIDQIVCTRGHIFVGTWFSTFSGYITGYMGYHDYSNYYGDKKHKNRFQHDELPMFPFYMREWNVSWTNMEEF
jgi:GDP-fucose protein O-fucosyltransferase